MKYLTDFSEYAKKVQYSLWARLQPINFVVNPIQDDCHNPQQTQKWLQPRPIYRY